MPSLTDLLGTWKVLPPSRSLNIMLKDIQKGKLYYYKSKWPGGDCNSGRVVTQTAMVQVEEGPGKGKKYNLSSGKHLVLALGNLNRCAPLKMYQRPDDYAYVQVLHVDDNNNKRVLNIVINSGFKVQDIFDGPLK